MKTGRPKLKRGLAKSVQIGVRFEPAEYKEIRAAAKRSMCKVPSWIRYVVRNRIMEFTEPARHTFRIAKTKKKPPKGFVGFSCERFVRSFRCPQCDGSDIKNVPRPDHTTTHHCQSCGLLWQFVGAPH